MSSKATYFNHVKKRRADRIRCPECLACSTLHDYVKTHARQEHGLDLRTQCIFCAGQEYWERGKRKYNHMVPCLKQFLEQHRVRQVPVEPQALPKKQVCSECSQFRSKPRQMFGRVKDRTSELVGLYDSVFERPDQYPSELEFTEESGLGRHVQGIVKRYEKGDLIWCHLMVRHQNFDNFVRTMKRIQTQIFLLPFWCLCDGMTPKRKTHRHMIIAYEPECGFETLWRERVKCDVPGNEKSKYCVRIKDAFHLIRTILYVSKRKSSCDGKRIAEDLVQGERLSHFHINLPMHEHAIAYMSTLFEGGMERLLKEQLRHKDVVQWREKVQKRLDAHNHGRYAVPIGITGFKFLQCVLPLAKWWEPTKEETPWYVTWLGKKKLYLRINDEGMHLSRMEWREQTVAKGNTFGCLKDEYYVLAPLQQNTMKQIKRTEKETTELERIRFEKKYQQLERKKHAIAKREESVAKEEKKWKNLKRKLSNVAVSNCETCLSILKEINEASQETTLFHKIQKANNSHAGGS